MFVVTCEQKTPFSPTSQKCAPAIDNSSPSSCKTPAVQLQIGSCAAVIGAPAAALSCRRAHFSIGSPGGRAWIPGPPRIRSLQLTGFRASDPRAFAHLLSHLDSHQSLILQGVTRIELLRLTRIQPCEKPTTPTGFPHKIFLTGVAIATTMLKFNLTLTIVPK